jgi:hypothetical protein
MQMAAKSSAAVAIPRVSVSQTDFPTVTLDKASAIAQCIWDNFAGKGAAAHDVAIAANMSPTGSNWRVLANAAIAYGLTTGGWNAKENQAYVAYLSRMAKIIE